jgi:hypothetical protein
VEKEEEFSGMNPFSPIGPDGQPTQEALRIDLKRLEQTIRQILVDIEVYRSDPDCEGTCVELTELLDRVENMLSWPHCDPLCVKMVRSEFIDIARYYYWLPIWDEFYQ